MLIVVITILSIIIVIQSIGLYYLNLSFKKLVKMAKKECKNKNVVKVKSKVKPLNNYYIWLN